jgi:cell division protein FtsW
MRKIITPKLECDRRTLLIVVVLTAIGVSLVASSSSYFSELNTRGSDPYFLLRKHIERIVIAFFVMVVAMRIDYRLYRRVAPAVLAVAVVTLSGLFVFGHVIRGAQSSFAIESLGVSVQPSEFARVALVLFLAYWVSRVGNRIEDPLRGYLPAAAAVLVVAGLVAGQRDMGTAAATMIIGFLMLFIGGARIRHLSITAAPLIAAAAVRVATTPYLLKRFNGFFNPDQDLSGINWQVYQSLISLGSGGVFGRGLGASRQKLAWLPDSHTDFIFSILGEEAGLFGTLAVSLLFLLLVARALKISTRSGDRFGECLVTGVACSIFVYTALNMFVATGLAPVTGLPLPFMSYGGSALVMNMFSVGVLLNVSMKNSTRGVNWARRKRYGGVAGGAVCGS